MKLTIDVKNIKDFQKAFDKFGDEVAFEVRKATDLQAQNTAEYAKREAPIDNAYLWQNIAPAKIDDYNWMVVSRAPYSGYVEFGTGKKVRIPPEMEGVASEFKKKGKGTFKDGLDAIKEWCKRHGIDEGAAYPIFINILNEGIEPQPFMYPAFTKARGEYKNNLAEAIQKIIKRNG